MNDRLPFFVYGTLMSGQGNSARFPRHLVTREPAFATGVSVCGGSWGVPYMRVEAAGIAFGELVTVKPDLPRAVYDEVLASVDRLEGFTGNPAGSLYQRVRLEVTSLNDPRRTTTAWTYIVERDLPPEERVIGWWDHPHPGAPAKDADEDEDEDDATTTVIVNDGTVVDVTRNGRTVPAIIIDLDDDSGDGSGESSG